MSKFYQPLAIVGLACRFPKGLDSVNTLWQSLKTRFNAIDTIPPSRWTADRFFSSYELAKGKSYIRRGGFLNQDITTFDANFFGISPRDAENMDPQQRLMLEVVWEAFENAGLSIPGHAGRQVGVYVGGFMLDHMVTQMSPWNRSQINQYTAAGMMMTMLSNRISHTFDFRGPSLSIDTACSSSLVAFHYACQELWRGTTDLAVVGGVNVIMRPEYPMGMCKGHFLSRDGESKSFDARADGYGRGEGAGAVLVKPLEAALANGDRILATVLGTGSNQDGHTPGISMPSGPAQKALIQQVCETYRIDPRDVRYVECHGTGTAIGDPTEAGAVGETYGAARKGLSPVVIGSIKSNIGHLEAGAGIAGVIKAVLTLVHRHATPLGNLKEPNPAIPFGELNLRLADDVIPLADESDSFCVAVNSFGYGGTNAHVVLQTAPAASSSGQSQGAVAERKFPFLLPVSARSEKALASLAGEYANQLRGETPLDDFLFTASSRRAALSQRAMVMGGNRAELIDGLEALSRAEENERVVKGVEPFQGLRKPVFVFTGMGPQWWGMGQELYRDEPIYRAAADEADAVFQRVSGFSILAEMLKSEEESRIGRTELAQPANLVVQIGVLAILRSAGIEPGVVVGHSVGELGSAYAAGVLSLEQAMTVSFHRSRLQATCAGTGAMLAAALSKEKAERLIEETQGSVSIAAINGPSSLTLAGDASQLDRIAEELRKAGIFHRKLEVEVPYHSPLMDPIMEPLATALASVRPQEPRIPLYSTVTGQRVHGVSYGADYWPLNIRKPVLFAQAVQAILDEGYNTFVEIGPHPVLSTSLKECIKEAGKECRTIQTLNRKAAERIGVHRAIMGVFAAGCEIDWSAHNPSGHLVQLPNYAWQRERFWLENDRGAQDRIAAIEHPILGIQEAPAVPAWRVDFDHEPLRYLRDHVVTGTPLFPAAGYVEGLLELAGLQFEDAAGLAIRNLEILAPMVINPDRGLDCVTSYEPVNRTATVRSLENGRLGGGQVHVVATLAGLKTLQQSRRDLGALLADCSAQSNIGDFYKSLAKMGLQYGPAFQSVRELRRSPLNGNVLARVVMDESLLTDLDKYRIHPTLLDACFQSLIAMLDESETTFLPTGFAELCVQPGVLLPSVWCLSEKIEQTERYVHCNLTLMDDQGQVIATIRGMRLTAASKRERTDQWGDRVKRQILKYEWLYGENLSEPKRLGHWLVIGEADGITDELSHRLEGFGATVAARVRIGESFQRSGSDFTIRPHNAEDAHEALSGLGDLDGIVFLHGLSATPDSHDPTGESAIASLVTILQSVNKLWTGRQPRAYLLTRSAFSANGHAAVVYPGQTALNGFARVAFNELEGLRFSTIDLAEEIDELTLDAAVLELLCDDPHDEVALRSGMRLVSELTDSTLLSEDRIAYGHLNDAHPVLVRPLIPGAESVGTVRVLAAPVRDPGPTEMRVRVESTLVPYGQLLNPSSSSIEQPSVEIVGQVVAVGAEVEDMSVGMRVCGFAPADLASHITADRSRFRIAEIEKDASAALLVGTIGIASRAEYAVQSLELTSSDSVVVQVGELGLAVAGTFRRMGVPVTLLGNEDEVLAAGMAGKFPVYSCCPEGIELAVAEQTGGKGFSVLVAGMQGWMKSFDQRIVLRGGSIIDTDDSAGPFVVSQHITNVVRTDLSIAFCKSRQLERAVGRAADLVLAGKVPVAPFLEVSINDLAWQKLPIAAGSNVVLSFETKGQDLPVAQPDELQFHGNATYLITGGFGGLGQKTAEWLAANGARHLVLTGRTGAEKPENKAFVERLEGLGVRVKAAACDTADLDRLTQVFSEISAEMPPLKGVFHSGAVIKDQPIPEIDLDSLSTVMRSKALGAWNLHLLTSDMNLDHFVLYSSVANLVGNSRQSAYSAANGFLNGLAHYRRALGLCGTSVNWGAIADVGVVAQDEKLEQFLRYTGLRGIESAEALAVMKQALARNVAQFGVTVISSWADWARFETRGGTSPRFAVLVASDSQGKDNSMRDALREELSTLSHADQVELVANLMLELIAAVLKSEPASISIDRAINQLGVDSLMGTEIQLLLDTKLGIKVSILELIGDSTIRSLANQAVKTLLSSSSEPVSVTAGA